MKKGREIERGRKKGREIERGGRKGERANKQQLFNLLQ